MLSIPAAIAGGISNAIGVQMFNLPMTPEHVWTAIKKQKPELLAEAL